MLKQAFPETKEKGLILVRSQGFHFFLAGMSIPVRNRVPIVQHIRVLCRLRKGWWGIQCSEQGCGWAVLMRKKGKGPWYVWACLRLQRRKIMKLNNEPKWPSAPRCSHWFFFFLVKNYFYLCVYACTCEGVCTHECRRPWRLEECVDPLELQLQVSVKHLAWVLGMKLSSPEKQ